jgi:uncharacterized membrane protein YbhN (UPF0104 family)
MPARWAFRLSRPALVRLALGAAVVLTGAVLLARLGDGIPAAGGALEDASVPWLVAALVAELLCYACIGQLLGRLLGGYRGPGRLVPFRSGLVIYGLGSLLPGSPAPGFGMAAIELRRRGFSSRRLSQAFLWCSWFNVRSFLALAALTGTTATFRGRVPSDATGFVIGAVLLVIGGLVVTSIAVSRPALAEGVAVLVGRLNWRGSRPSWSPSRAAGANWHADAMESLGSRRNQVLIGCVALGSWVADAICLRLALIAVGVHAGMGIILIAYVASMLVSLVPLLPGGFGLVEATVPAVLHHYGFDLEAAVAGTLAWRGLALLLPAIAGGVALVTLRLQPSRVVQAADSVVLETG